MRAKERMNENEVEKISRHTNLIREILTLCGGDADKANALAKAKGKIALPLVPIKDLEAIAKTQKKGE